MSVSLHSPVRKIKEGSKGIVGPADWQACERAERRNDAKVARTIIVALPHELDLNTQVSLLCRLARGLREHHGVTCGWALHEGPGDPLNRHGHLLLTTRVVDDTGVYGAKVRALEVRPTSAAIIARWPQSPLRDARSYPALPPLAIHGRDSATENKQ